MADVGAIGRCQDIPTGGTAFVQKRYVRTNWLATSPAFVVSNQSAAKAQKAYPELGMYDPNSPSGAGIYSFIYSKYVTSSTLVDTFGIKYRVIPGPYISGGYIELSGQYSFENATFTWPGSLGDYSSNQVGNGEAQSVGSDGTKLGVCAVTGGSDLEDSPHHNWFAFIGWDSPQDSYNYTPGGHTYIKESHPDLGVQAPANYGLISGLYHHKRNVSYIFLPMAWVDGGSVPHLVLRYRKYNPSTNLWDSSVNLTGWTGGPTAPNAIYVVDKSMFFVRSGTDDVVYAFYRAKERASPYGTGDVVTEWVGIVVFNAVTASVISHVLHKPAVDSVYAPYLSSDFNPRRTQPQVFTKLDGTNLTQTLFGGGAVRVSWTTATYQTPTVTFKPLPNLPDMPGWLSGGNSLMPGWESLEFKYDELYHIIYMVGASLSGVYTYKMWGLYNDVSTLNQKWMSTPQLASWTVSYWDKWDEIYASVYGYQSKTYLYGSTSNRVYTIGSGSRNIEVWVDWWVQRDTKGQVTVAPLCTLSITGYVDGPPRVDIEIPQPFVNLIDITARVDRPKVVGLSYDDLPASAIVEGEVDIDIVCTLYINPDGVLGAPDEVILNIVPTVIIEAVTVNIQTKDQHVDSLMWDQDWAEDLMDLINTDRVGEGLAPVALMTAAKLGSLTDITQRHAENMRDADTVAIDSALFPIGWQNYLTDRQTRVGHGGAELNIVMRLNEDYTVTPDLDPNRLIINDYSFPTAQQVWDLHEATFQSYFRNTFLGHTELYFMAGMATAKSVNYFSADGNVVYLCFDIFDWESMTGEPPPGPTEPTPPTNTIDLIVPYPVLGAEWHEEFLAIVNAVRVQYGLVPFLMPTATDFINHEDVAQAHSQNMGAARVFAHDDPAFPAGYRTAEERFYVAKAVDGFGMENLIVRIDHRYDPYSEVESDSNRMIVNDSNLLTPQQAFDTWWYSPGHRSNLLRYTEDRKVVSYMGLAVGPAPLYIGTSPSGYGNQWLSMYYTHKMMDLKETVMEILLGANYQFTGALIEELPVTYNLTAYTQVRKEHVAIDSMRISKDHSGDYGCRVSSQHVALLQYRVAKDNTSVYSGLLPLGGKDHEGIYHVKELAEVAQDNSAVFSLRITALHSAVYGPPKNNFWAGHQADYSLMPNARGSHKADYGDPFSVRADNKAVYFRLEALKADYDCVYSLMLNPRADCEGVYGLLDNVKADAESLWDISTFDPVAVANRAFWSLSEGTPAPTVSDCYVTVGGVDVPISDAVVTQSEDSPQWEARFRLTNIADYAGMQERQAVTLVLGGEVYELIITGKSLSRNAPPNVDAQITAKSALVLLGSPYAAKVDYRYQTPMLASAIVADMIGAVDWQMVDWSIPADRVQLAEASPLDAANTIVSVVGGIMQCEKDGSVTVRSLYPVSTKDFDLATPDHTLTDDADALSVSEEYEFKEGYNKFRIREGEATFGDSIEYEASEGDVTKGLMQVYPSPWRSTWRVYSTDNTTLLTPKGVVERSEEELVQFAEGNASTRYPISSITNVKWFSQSLGGLVFDAESKALSSGTTVNYGYGLAMITYLTQSYDYDVVGVLDTATLVLMEDQGE